MSPDVCVCAYAGGTRCCSRMRVRACVQFTARLKRVAQMNGQFEWANTLDRPIVWRECQQQPARWSFNVRPSYFTMRTGFDPGPPRSRPTRSRVCVCFSTNTAHIFRACVREQNAVHVRVQHMCAHLRRHNMTLNTHARTHRPKRARPSHKHVNRTQTCARERTHTQS